MDKRNAPAGAGASPRSDAGNVESEKYDTSPASRIPAHPAATIVPLLGATELRALADDIAANGLHNPIEICDGQVLDGRNRLAACELAGVEPEFVYVAPDDPTAYVLGLNLHRRHLSTSQRALIAGRLCQNSDTGTRAGAKALGVSHQSVAVACQLLEHGDAELIEKVERGAITLNRAQQRIVRREAAESPPLPDGTYDVILADPPWRLGNDNFSGAPALYYPTMEIDEICALPVRDLAADSAVLYLWSVASLLPEALEVMRAWGFTYKSQLVWSKPPNNMGYYVAAQHELILIGNRGQSMLPIDFGGERPPSVIEAPRAEHSVKPEIFHEAIERAYPGQGIRRLELFARSARPGWDVWGNQAPEAVAS